MAFNFRGKGFFDLLKDVLIRCLRGRPKLTIAILSAETISVISRISAVLILSLMATAMNNDGKLTLRNYEFTLPDNLFHQGLIGGSLILVCLLFSAVFGFTAVFFARKLARWMNEQAIDDIMTGLAQSPEVAIRAPYTDPDVFNRFLTQNAIHYGMLSETLIRMANPIALFILAWVVVFFQTPSLAIGVVLFVILFTPLFLKLFLRTQNVAQNFYADSAVTMGQGVNSAVLSLNPQYGLFHGPQQEKMVKHFPYMRDFLDALDDNILANERMGLLVGVIGALFVAFVVGVNSYLADQKAIDIGGIIALTGGFLYLVASARTVSSLLTNLVRFYPQVKSIRDFAEPLKSPESPKTNIGLPKTFIVKASDQETTQLDGLKIVRGGARVGLITPFPLSKFSITKILTPLISPGANKETLARNLNFVSARYRFKPDETIATNISAGRAESLERSVQLAENLGVLEEFNALPDGLATMLDENIFKSLSGVARTALRLLPLMSSTEPRLVIIDVSAVRNLNPNTFDDIFENLNDAFVIILMSDHDCPKNLAETFLLSDGEKITGIGDREWLSTLELDQTQQQSNDGPVIFL